MVLFLGIGHAVLGCYKNYSIIMTTTTTLISPIRNIRYDLLEPLFLMDHARQIVLPEKVVFYLEGASLEARVLQGLRLSFSLEDSGQTLIFLGSDDPMYFAQFDRIMWIETAVQSLLHGAKQGLDVYIEGQLSGMPKGLLQTEHRLMQAYPGLMRTDYVPGQMTAGHHSLPMAAQHCA